MKILGLELKRLNRSSYILTALVSMFVFVGVGLILSSIFNLLIGPADLATPDSPHPLGLIPLQILWFAYYTICTAKRLHDMDMNGWLSFGLYVPIVGLIIGILLIFNKGTTGANKYGNPLNTIRIMGIRVKSEKDHGVTA